MRAGACAQSSTGIGGRTLMRLTLGVMLLSTQPVAAENFVTPTISFSRVDWRAAIEQLRSETAARPAATGSLTFSRNRRHGPFDQRRAPAIMQLNAITAGVFPGVGRSPIPVLLPFDTPGYLADRMADALAGQTHYRYLSGFRAIDFFEAGASGYTAVVTATPGGTVEFPSRLLTQPVEIHITGSLLTYTLTDPLIGKGETVRTLSGQYPDLRRTVREGSIRYAFTRFNIPYVVSIQCFDSAAKTGRLSCREASNVAEHFLKSLRLVGGKPSPPRPAVASAPVERPADVSADFTYRAPGQLIGNSGYRRLSGNPDRTVYAQIRFPIEQASPTYATSQSSYPWQDNFCEARDYQAGQCPGGFGHQGQDIRPAGCSRQSSESEHCDRYGVLAVRDAVVIRSPRQQALQLLVNSNTEHVRFRYMYLNTPKLEADGLVHGRRVAEGERIGVVSNHQDLRGRTPPHLHFDLQVFTRDGWVWINPYSTLIASYERLLGARGRELAPDPSPPATITTVSQTAEPANTEGAEDAN